MSYDPNREGKRKKRFIQETVVKLVLIIFFALLFAAEFGFYNGDSSAVMENITNDLMQPRPGSVLPIPALFSIFPLNREYIIKFVAVGLMGWLIWFMTDWIKYTERKNMRPGEEHGSASFNLNYSGMEHDYIMSPKVLKDGKKREVFFNILKEGGFRNVK